MREFFNSICFAVGYISIHCGHTCSQHLLTTKTSPDQVDPQNGTFPLPMAARNGHSTPVELLLKAKNNPDQVNPENGNFLLLMAARHGHSTPVELLLKASPGQVNPQNGTFPLLLAAQNAPRGATAESQSQPKPGRSPKWPLPAAQAQGRAERAPAPQLKAKAHPDQVDPQYGTFLLLMAAKTGHSTPVEFLLKAMGSPPVTN